jgi:hypothetical protein
LHNPFPELLKDETGEVDLITPTLPAFRSLLAVSCHPEAHERYEKLVHGLLSACLLNVDEMRFVLISSRKVKTNLLAAVLILTVIPPQVPVARDVVEHLFFLISQKLEDGDEVSSSSGTIRLCRWVLLHFRWPSLLFIARKPLQLLHLEMNYFEPAFGYFFLHSFNILPKQYHEWMMEQCQSNKSFR